MKIVARHRRLRARLSFPIFAVAIVFASSACATLGAGSSSDPAAAPSAGADPGLEPSWVKIPRGSVSDPRLARAMDLQAAVDQLPPLFSAATATSVLAELGPNEAVDLEMEAERALEEEVLEEIEQKAETSTVVRSILAVTGTVTYDIPMAEDQRVADWIRYLMGPFRRWYAIWLSRSTRYVPIFRSILREYGLPEDLIFLAMIESGFSPNAYSWAHAAGPWQFIPWTGKHYGLDVGFWLDERRDFVHATHAAAKYLRKLYDEFGDWYLAWAAYNAGEAKIEKAIRRSGTRDFWKLSRTLHLRRETRHYVPKLLAAAIIAKQPDRYGFGDVQYLAPFDWDVMTVTTAVDLKTLAKACGDLEIEDTLKFLNPALRRYVTPPGRSYEVRVPKGRSPACLDGLRAIPDSERISYRYHRVQRNETAAAIAKKYQTSVEAICAFNRVEPKKLPRAGELVIPIPASKEAEIPIIKPPDLPQLASYAPEGAPVVVHRVREGDSLWKIAQHYRVTVQKLRLWNGLWRSSRLQIGQAIRIFRGGGKVPRG